MSASSQKRQHLHPGSGKKKEKKNPLKQLFGPIGIVLYCDVGKQYQARYSSASFKTFQNKIVPP